MFDYPIKVPVAFLIFNRPDTTERVFEAIRQAKPPKLLVVADGPRADKPGEVEKCAAARAVIDRVDWECEIMKNYADANMGCGQRVSSGLDWVFNTVERAIILEDDCLPHPTFFRFCEEMLEMYGDDERILMISGTNMLGEWKSNIQSYHFSYYGGIWGWASWRRAWKYYDINMSLWSEPEIKARIRDVLADRKQYESSKKLFDNASKIDTWDYPWRFARLVQSGLSIVPSVNLVSNIGFREDATHTKTKANSSELAEIKTVEFKFPIKSNEFTVVDRDFDRLVFEKDTKSNLLSRIKNKIKNLIYDFINWINTKNKIKINYSNF
ncbi:MAG: glycosyltransferase family 2 protein [Symploca sp. SIO2E9]|nr:glycosyltransferase family 2 protein [Symploca sp. SIO2E9]